MPTESPTTLGDALKWGQMLLRLGSPYVMVVTGAETASVSVKIKGEKRLQSMPPGDILVVVLPPGIREPGVRTMEAKS